MNNDYISNYSKSNFSNCSFGENFDLPFNQSNFPDEGNYFICRDCWKTPLIEFKNQTIFLQCKCQNTEDYKININYKKLYLLDDYLINNLDDNNNEKSPFICQKHKNENYKYYCDECMDNLCEECNKSHDHNKHKNKIDFDLYQNVIKTKMLDLYNIFIGKDEENETEIKNLPKITLLKKLFNAIIYNYKRHPNFNLFRNLESIDINVINKILVEDTQKEVKIKIYSSRELFEKIDNNNKGELKSIQYIKIFQSDFSDIYISKLCGIDLNSLLDIDLNLNNIYSIKPLIKFNCPNLQRLNLERNKIDDTNIEYIYDLNFPKLEELNFNNNYFSDYKFFKSIQKFKNLNKLNIGSNKFDKNTFNNEKYSLNSIIKLILSNGVFNDYSIEILKYFDLQKIETIDLSCNNLSSLSFVKYVDWPNLTTILLSNNDIEDIKDLYKFKNLELLEIYNNKISDIEEIKKTREILPFLNVNLSLYYKDDTFINNNNDIHNASTCN